MLYRIVSNYFVAGIIVASGGNVFLAAPIVKYMKNWHIKGVEAYCRKKGWTCDAIS